MIFNIQSNLILNFFIHFFKQMNIESNSAIVILGQNEKITQVFSYDELVHKNKQLLISKKQKMNSKSVTSIKKHTFYVQKAVDIALIPQAHFDYINKTEKDMEKFISECIFL